MISIFSKITLFLGSVKSVKNSIKLKLALLNVIITRIDKKFDVELMQIFQMKTE